MRNLHFIFFIWSIHFNANFVLGLQADDRSPTALFSALFWEKHTSKTLSYAPWGNDTEDNASMIKLNVGFNGLSPKFAYYGEGALKFFEKKYYSDFQISLMNEKEKELMDEMPVVAEFPFSAKEEEVQEFILLFLKDSDNDKRFKIYPLPFSKKILPYGYYQFISQAREELNFTINQERMKLDPGAKVMQNFSALANSPTIRVSGYRKDDDEFKEFYSENFSNSNARRGYLFFSPNKKRIKITSLLERKSPLEKALGYGAKRTIGRKELEKKNSPLPSTTSRLP